MTEGYRRMVTVCNPKGLHARPSAAVAEIAKAYEATVLVDYNGETEEAESILGLLTLGATPGAKLSIYATGHDAKPAVDAIVCFLEAGGDKR
jgi:phosphocarrier protein HPr